MNPYCTDLNVKLTPLIKDIATYGYTRLQHLSSADLHPSLHAFFKTYNIKAFVLELFYTSPGKQGKIHIDSTGGDYVKINFRWGGDASLMNWYVPKPGLVNGANSRTELGTRSVEFLPEEVDLVHQQCVNFPSLVQVGIPHSVTNDDSHRWCLSIVIVRPNGKRITMAEAKVLFKDIIT